MKAGIYARSATGDPSQLCDQEARCRAYASAHGWEVVAVWADAGSGVAYDRAGLRALKEAIAARDVDAVIATNAARYARDSGVLADPVAEAQTAHVSLHTIEGPIDPSGIALQRIVNEARRSM